MKMYQTLKYRYKPSKKERKIMKLLCHISKNIYNKSLYLLRQNYFDKKTVLSDYLLNARMKENENLRISSMYASPCTIKAAYSSFMKFIKGIDKMPAYLGKHAMYPIIANRIIKFKSGEKLYFKLPMSALTKTSKIFNQKFEDELINMFIKESDLKESFEVYFKIPRYLYKKNIHQVRIVPRCKGRTFDIEFSYFDEPKKAITKIGTNIMGIDIGVNNLAACVISNNKSFIIDGKYLKSINHFYNKKIAHFQSKKPDNNKYTNAEYLITDKRNRRIKDAINKAVSMIIKECIKENVGEIIIGYNPYFKRGGIKARGPKPLISQINQNFVQLPLAKFKDKLQTKCAEYGIIFKQVNESYTSRCSFYDNEVMSRRQQFKGKRFTRSLFKTSKGFVVNADINAALNILKKGKPERIDIINFLRNTGLTIPYRYKIKLS